MNKKNMGIIVILASIFLIVGIGFNSVFSKANEKKGESNQEVAKIEKNINDKNKLKTDLEEDNDKNEEEIKEKVDNKSDDKKEKDENKDDSSEKLKSEESTSAKDDNKPESSKKPSNDTNSNNTNSSETNKKPEQESKPEVPKKDTVTIAISCKTAINNGVNKENGFTHLPSNGVILGTKTVEIKEGDTVFEVLQKVVRDNNIHMEYTGSGSTIYIEGIHNLYEFDGGPDSGWMYSVNGWYPNYGAGVYKLKANDVIKWNYTCDLGADLGRGMN